MIRPSFVRRPLTGFIRFMTDSPASLTTVEINIDDQQEYEQLFPLIISPREKSVNLADMQRWLGDNRRDLLAKLAEHGAILLRGFPIATDENFDLAVGAFNLENFAYKNSLSNAVRTNRTERVFTANEAPPDVSIYLHHEMAQTPIFPSKLFFYCELASTVGGATPLCRSDVLLTAMEKELPDFVRDCEVKGVTYSNVMPAFNDKESGQGRSWQSTLDASNKAEAETRLQKLNYAWQWLEDGSLRSTTPVLPAIRELPDGRRVFFNQLIAAYRGWKDSRNEANKSISFGDGSTIGPAEMARVIELSDKLTFDLNWQTGDMALVDNFLVMHWRRAYEGTRRVLASLVQ
jgi:hypothetical protein